MKEIVGIIIIIIIVSVASYAIQQYLNKTSDDLLFELKNLKNEIMQARESGNIDNAKAKSNEILKKWDEIDEMWSTVVMHQELDSIRLSILEVNGAIEAESLDDALQEIDKTIFIAGHVKEKEVLMLKNIF